MPMTGGSKRPVSVNAVFTEPRRDQEQGGGAGLSWLQTDCLAAEVFLNRCFSDTVFVALFRTAVETAISGVQKLLLKEQIAK